MCCFNLGMKQLAEILGRVLYIYQEELGLSSMLLNILLNDPIYRSQWYRKTIDPMGLVRDCSKLQIKSLASVGLQVEDEPDVLTSRLVGIVTHC